MFGFLNAKLLLFPDITKYFFVFNTFLMFKPKNGWLSITDNQPQN